MKTVIMGLGYIGLPTAALIAGKGIDVLGVDVNPEVVNSINQGKIHIVEPELDALVEKAVSAGKLKASLKPIEAEIFVIAVPTPFKGNYDPDLAYVESATRMIIPFLRESNLIILESTSPVGSTRKIQEWVYQERPELFGKISFAYCPERVLPGKIVFELENNDRVIGGTDEESTKKAVDFYRHFVTGALHETTDKTAEMCKLVENSFRDVNIAFANELSLICDKAGINVWELIKLANKHPRVNILQPGAGVGGHCIAVDPWFIVSDFPEQARMIRTGREVNNFKTEWVISRVEAKIAHLTELNSRPPLVACMGLAFKPDIDDLRESPAVHITEHLLLKGHNIRAVEPNIHAHSTIPLISLEEAQGADLQVFLVSHSVFKNILPKSEWMDFCGVHLNK